MKEALVIEGLTGITGEKLIASFIDLGASKNKLQKSFDVLAQLIKECDYISLKVKEEKIGEIWGRKVEIEVREKLCKRKAGELKEIIKACIHTLKLQKKGKFIAKSILDTIILAESKIHKVPIEELVLYELSSSSVLAQILGVVLALQDLNLLNKPIYSTPIAVGSGYAKVSHGVISIPCFSTLEILASKQFLIRGGPVEAELTTPLGASIIVNIANCIPYLPLMQIKSIGYGIGKEVFPGFINVLRTFIGKLYLKE